MQKLKQTAIITGASSGIGAVYAERLASRGFDLSIVARNKSRLEDLAAKLEAQHDVSVTLLPADLSSPADLDRLERVLRTDPSISLIVNNAGFGGVKTLLESDVSRMLEMIAVNVTALTRLTYAVVPGMVERAHGTVINIASTVAIAPELLNGVYGGTKAFVLAFSQSLRKEMAGKGVEVQVVMPGATGTEFWDVAGLGLHNVPSGKVMATEDLVGAALVGLDRGEFATIPSLQDGAEWDGYEAARQVMLPHFRIHIPQRDTRLSNLRKAADRSLTVLRVA